MTPPPPELSVATQSTPLETDPLASPTQPLTDTGFVRERAFLMAAAAGGAALALAWWLRADAPRAALWLVGLCYLVCSPFAVLSAWEALRSLRIDANVMMVLGAALCVIIGEPGEGALLLFLFALSGALEKLATGRAERAIDDLGKRFPTEAVVERDGARHRVPLADVQVNDRLIVRPGDLAACDGIVQEGDSHVDESAITGEYMPAAKHPGDRVFAGSLNGDGPLVVRVTRAARESTLAQVSAMVAAARAEKSPLESLIERVGRWYGPAVLLFAVGVLLVSMLALGHSFTSALYRAITVMIVASPCALMIATPVPTLCAIATAARHGIVTRGGRNFEKLAAAHTLFVDKTGTLTTGRIRVAAVRMVDGTDQARMMAVAAALERDSTHPLAAAVLTAARDNHSTVVDARDVKNVPGHGMTGHADGIEWRLGRPAWAVEALESRHRAAILDIVAAESGLGRTTVVLAGGGEGAVLSFEDSLRKGVADFLRELRRLGLNRIELLTGDGRGAAESIARQVGLDACHAQLLPQDKVDHVARAAREGPGVVMLGDGVNDAPALARADVGIGMGGIGSHTALQSSDFVLLNDRVELLAGLVRLARTAHRITRQNIAFALGVIILLAGWAAIAAHPRLALGVIGHEGSTVLVALNGLRVLAAWDARR